MLLPAGMGGVVTPTVSCFGFCGRPVTCGRMHGPPPQRTAQHHRLHAPKLTVVSGRHARHQDRCTRLRHRYNFVQRSRRSTNIQALFTGIVQGKACVMEVDSKESFSSLKIEFPHASVHGVQLGASVAINGTCLTVTSIEQDILSFDIIVETLRATNLGQLRPGSYVNYERSARMGDEIGGHNVSGHVHTCAEISDVEDTEYNRKLVFQVGQEWMKYILPKGFIAVDGCSLTVGEVGADCFSVYLIPETLRVTVLGEKGVNDTVNIEIDARRRRL